MQPLLRRALTAGGEVTTAATLHLLHRAGQTKAYGHLDDAKVVKTQLAEKAAKNIYHRAAWCEAPKF